MQFTWVNTDKAEFQIEAPNSCNEIDDENGDDCLILVSVDQEIIIKPIGGWNPVGNSGYKFDYEIKK